MHELFDHTADLGLRITAPSLNLLMADAALGIFEIIIGDLSQIRPVHAERFEVAGTDPVWLLFDWVSELHAAFELRRMLFCAFEVEVNAAGPPPPEEMTAWSTRPPNSRRTVRFRARSSGSTNARGGFQKATSRGCSSTA
ncbi:MAG: archease [Planctomycetes bacterium]|nr:archease [Planctomycetota bacterium]